MESRNPPTLAEKGAVLLSVLMRKGETALREGSMIPTFVEDLQGECVLRDGTLP